MAWLIVEWVLSPIFREFHEPFFRIDKFLHLMILFVWVFMIIKTSHEERYSLPIIGELAERSAAESSVWPVRGSDTPACRPWTACVSGLTPACPLVPSAAEAWQTAQRIGLPFVVTVAYRPSVL